MNEKVDNSYYLKTVLILKYGTTSQQKSETVQQ